jgi:hypothetical protein
LINIVLSAGINNLTQKKTIHGKWYISYTESKKHLVISAFNDFLLLISKFPNVKCHIATIQPASIPKSIEYVQSKFKISIHESNLKDQQTLLEQDIKDINLFINQSNYERSVPTINLHKFLTKTRTRKRGCNGKNVKKETVFFYSHLFDGLHPDEVLAQKCFNFIISQTSLVDTDSNESESDNEWDFKRTKKCSN